MLISVGILFAPAIRFRLHGIFHEKNMPGKFSGEYAVLQTPDGIFLQHPNNRYLSGCRWSLLPKEKRLQESN